MKFNSFHSYSLRSYQSMKNSDINSYTTTSFQALYKEIQPSFKESHLTQTELVNKLFQAISKDKISKISQSTASRYIHGSSIRRKALKINNRFNRKTDFVDKLDDLVNWEKLKHSMGGISKPKTQAQLYKQFQKIISEAAENKTNSSKKVKSTASHTTTNSVKSSLIQKVIAKFSSRFQNENEYFTAFDIFIASKDVYLNEKGTFIYPIKNWKLISDTFFKVPLLLARKQYTYQDAYKDYDHPFGIGQIVDPYELFSPEALENITTKLTKNGKIYVDKKGVPIKNEDGVVLKPNMKKIELNPPKPHYAYIAEITSYNKSKFDSNNVKINFIYHILGKFPYQILYSNAALFGINTDILFNITDLTGQATKFDYISNINFLSRLDKLIVSSKANNK